MMEAVELDAISSIAGYERLIASCDQAGVSRFKIGETLFGTPIFAYDTDGGPLGEGRVPILVTAGAHAEEAAGVLTALRLLHDPGVPLRLVIVPCRDPLGWDGVRRTFARAVGKEVPMASHSQALAAFARYGEILWDDAGFTVARLGDLAFCSFSPEHPGNEDTGEFVQAYLRERPERASVLRGLRLLVPGSPALAEGRDVYDWGGGPTVYVDHTGRVGNMNRFFASERPPVEVSTIRSLVDQIRPAYLFDLHENFGDKFGMYTNAADPEKARRIYVAMIDAVAAAGYPLMPLKELLPYLGLPPGVLLELYPGVYSPNRELRRPADGLGSSLTARGIASFTTEMGLGRPLAYRAGATEVAVRAGLETIAAMERGV